MYAMMMYLYTSARMVRISAIVTERKRFYGAVFLANQGKTRFEALL